MVTDIVKMIEEALVEIDEYAQPRSNYALIHFVVGQHDLPARQRKQVLDELQTLLYAINDLADQHELAQIELDEIEERLSAGIVDRHERRRLEIRIRQLRRGQWHTEYMRRGREREAVTLLGILDVMPKYTLEEFEQEEVEYWRRRLTRQYMEAQLGGAGNISALVETMTTPGAAKPLLPGQDGLYHQLFSGGDDKRLEAGDK